MNRLVQAYQEDLLSLDELRSRMPDLRKKESAVRAELDALEAQLIDQETYLKLAENLENFLARLRDAADSSSVEERQRVLRLIVKEVRVGPERFGYPSLNSHRGVRSDPGLPFAWEESSPRPEAFRSRG